MTFGPAFVALQSEGFLAQGCLAAGLTAIRNAQFPDKANFYKGFFQLSVALERVLKLVLVIEHMRNNSFQPPNNAQIKIYGHKLVQLYSACDRVAQSNTYQPFHMPVNGSLEEQILIFLSEFATKSRYYNLDSLDPALNRYVDPLVAWDAILSNVLKSDVPESKQLQRVNQAKEIHALIEDSIYVLQHGMDGRLLSSQDAFVVPAQHEVAAPYAMVRVFGLVRPALLLLGECARRAFEENMKIDRAVLHVPLMHEFFQLYDGSPVEIRRKKRWP